MRAGPIAKSIARQRDLSLLACWPALDYNDLTCLSFGRVMATEILECTLPGAGPVAVRVRPVAINILVGNEQPSYSFDLAGRLIGAFEDGCNYRRALDGRVLRKWAGPDGRRRQWLSAEESGAFAARVHTFAQEVADTLGDTRVEVLRGWTAERLAADVAWFSRIYRPVSILPPDQYLALVIQATEGCSYNRCTFCDFYRDRPFRIKSPAELRAHIEEVQAFFGAALGLRKSLFLADANALVAPMPRIRAWLDQIDGAGVRRPGGIFSFIDAFDVGRKTAAEWAELGSRGLRRVYIGMESGDDALLRFLAKPGTANDVVDAVRTLKAGNVAVSVIIMTGAGGQQYAESHVANTVAALNAMPLGEGDIIYFSPFFEQPGSAYAGLAASAGILPLSPDQVAGQEAALRAGLRTGGPDPAKQLRSGGASSRGAQISRYDIREFVY